MFQDETTSFIMTNGGFFWNRFSGICVFLFHVRAAGGRRPECVFVCVFSESEDEVEEIEERVPSPDIATEESAPFYDPTPWYVPQALTASSDFI